MFIRERSLFRSRGLLITVTLLPSEKSNTILITQNIFQKIIYETILITHVPINDQKKSVFLAKYVALTKNKIFANILLRKLQEKTKKDPSFEFNIITTTVTNNVKNYKIFEII